MKVNLAEYTKHDFVNLPLKFIDKNHHIVPEWNLTDIEKNYLQTIEITNENTQLLEQATIQQKNS